MQYEEEWRAQVGARLRDARVAAGLSQKQVADALGRTPQLVSAQEDGSSEVKGSQLRVLCLLYGKSSDFLLFNVRVVPVIRRRAEMGPTDDEDAPSVLSDILGRAGAADPAGV